MIRLGQYILTEELHRTERAALYRGHPEGTLEKVLCKVLASEHPSPRDIEKLRHDHAISRTLEIPEVARPVGLYAHGHGVALVLADPDGQPLRERMRGAR